MNLDDLARAIQAVSPEPEAQRLADLLIQWKQGPESVEDLREQVDSFLGDVRFSRDGTRTTISNLWSEFVREGIEPIHGFTMNERLYYFGLFPQYDAVTTRRQKLVFYSKLLAKP
jgi:hypothetical protein